MSDEYIRTNYREEIFGKVDPIYVRASVARTCNLNCIYCPKKSGMENQVPTSLNGKLLSPADYCSNLKHIARNGINGVSFTGGEPTLNPDLPLIISEASNFFERVELTTNGFNVSKILHLIAPQLDLIKISLDGLDSEFVKNITKSNQDEVTRAITAIRDCSEAGVNVGVNVVVMRSNISQIKPLINLCREINKNFSGKTYISLLDFYYSPEKRDVWEKEFLPLELLKDSFTSLYGIPTKQERFGCQFFWYNADGVNIRFKDSISTTYRAKKCETCKLYCQEGIYGLKHSVEGWVTTCPNGDPEHGVYLKSQLSNEEVDILLAKFLEDIHFAKHDPDSFQKLIQIHELNPNIILSSNFNYGDR